MQYAHITLWDVCVMVVLYACMCFNGKKILAVEVVIDHRMIGLEVTSRDHQGRIVFD